MTKDEIKALIASITKENTTEQVHADVLNALVDMIGGGEWLNIHDYVSLESIDTDNFHIQTGTTKKDIQDLVDGKYFGAVNEYGVRLVLVYASMLDDDIYSIILGSTGSGNLIGGMWELLIDYTEDNVTTIYTEV